MQNLSKWVEQIRPKDSVAKAARVTLKSRLPTVVHFLRLAAHRSEKTTEHVHQLRVSTRRSLAALHLYQSTLRNKKAKWFRKWLRRIRKAAEDARDLDVYLQRYQSKEDQQLHVGFVRSIKKRRRKAQRPIALLASDLIDSGRFEKRTKSLIKSISKHRACSKQNMRTWGRCELSRVADEFFANVPAEPYEFETLHQFRVQGKELRYTMELLASVFPKTLRTEVYPLVGELQDRLGILNDHATAIRRLNQWIAACDDAAKVDYLQALITQEENELRSSIDAFGDWWTPDFASDLQFRLGELTSNTSSRKA